MRDIIEETMGYHSYLGKNGFVYILANYNRNVLYVGVTSDLVKRVWDHKRGNGCEFTRKYNVKYLMYFEKYSNMNTSIQREKQLKNWRREWKLNLVKKSNPSLKDLWDNIK